jgi:hypothetical protein
MTQQSKMKRQNIFEIEEDVRSRYPKLTPYESLRIATEIERNQLLVAAFNISSDDSYPTNLEAIGIALGYSSQMSVSIPSAMSEIAEAISDMKDK